MKTSRELKYAVQEVLIDMSIDCTLPSDMTCLDIEEVFRKAEKLLENDVGY